MSCDSVGKQLPMFLYGELSFNEEERVQEHLDTCENCRRELQAQRSIHAALDSDEAPLPAGLLTQNRRELRAAILNAEALHSERLGWWDRLLSSLQPAGYRTPLGATAMLALGFLAAKLTTGPGPSVDGFSQAGLTPVASRVRNVEPNGAGTVQIVVEETRERTLSGGLQDDRIRQLLLTAARDSSDPGLRVESMDILRTQPDSTEVRKALLQALQQDPNPGVRLKALEGLKLYAADPETRKALTRVLLSDQNPGVRTQAVDLLIQRKEPAMVGVFQELLQKEENGYVRQRCERALRDMNASVETF